jgi:hypothetical protein
LQAFVKLHKIQRSQEWLYYTELRTLNGREFSSGDKCSDAIALGDWEQEMRWAIGVVIDSYLRRLAA